MGPTGDRHVSNNIDVDIGSVVLFEGDGWVTGHVP